MSISKLCLNNVRNGTISSLCFGDNLNICLSLLLFPFLIQIVSFISLLTSLIDISNAFFIAYIIFVFISIFILKTNLISFSFINLIILISIFSACYMQDFSWDSRSYHLPASIQIMEGWNPLYNVNPPIISLPHIIGFMKGQWYINAASISALSSIEAGKFTHFIYLFASIFSALLYVDKTNLKKKIQVLLCISACFSPLVISQINVNYVDGALSSLITTLSFLYLNIIKQKTSVRSKIFVALFIVTVLIASIKTSGILYLSIYWLYYLLRFNTSFSEVKEKLVFLSFLALITILLNYNPLVTNLMNFGNPIYPLLSEDIKLSWDFFENTDRFSRFFISYFSAPVYINGGVNDPLIIWNSPFYISSYKQYIPLDLDRTFGAAGPFFLLLLIFLAKNYRKLHYSEKNISLVILTCAFIHADGWMLRYSPQVWLLPHIFLLSYVNDKRKELKLSIYSSILLLSSLIVVKQTYPSTFSRSSTYFNSICPELVLDSKQRTNNVKNFIGKSTTQPHLGWFVWVEEKRLEYLKSNLESTCYIVGEL